MHQMSADGVMLENEAMQAVADIHLGQLGLQELVELSGVRLAAGRFHDLADEESEQLVLAAAIVGELLWVCGDDRIYHALDRSGVGDLLEPLGLDDGVR